MIEMSSQIDQFSRYVKSRRTRSSNAEPERPEICQRPVIPGSTRYRAPVPVLEQPVVPERERSRADEAHLALDDVDDLRDLVEREAAQEPADARDPRVVADLEERALRLVHVLELRLELGRVGDHRPELEHPELALAHADAAIDEEARARASRA